ncbi:hypothetical protein VCHA53O466_40141 [Vibrio chagasii]|nr:hypothetical protein VCHA53O466_40141 [Vibrio chagasii]
MKLKVGLTPDIADIHDAHVRAYKSIEQANAEDNVELTPFLTDEESLSLKSKSNPSPIKKDEGQKSNKVEETTKESEKTKEPAKKSAGENGSDIIYQAPPPSKTSLGVKLALLYTLGLSTYSGYHTIQDSNIALNLLKNETEISFDDIKRSIYDLDLRSSIGISNASATSDEIKNELETHIQAANTKNETTLENFGLVNAQLDSYKSLFDEYSHKNDEVAAVTKTLSESLNRLSEYENSMLELQAEVESNTLLGQESLKTSEQQSESQKEYYIHINEVIADQNRIIKDFTPEKMQAIISSKVNSMIEELEGSNQSEVSKLRVELAELHSQIANGHIASPVASSLPKRGLTGKILSPVEKVRENASESFTSLKDQQQQLSDLEVQINNLKRIDLSQEKSNASLIKGLESRQSKLEESFIGISDRFTSIDESISSVTDEVHQLNEVVLASISETETHSSKIESTEKLVNKLKSSIEENLNNIKAERERLQGFAEEELTRHKEHEGQIQKVSESISTILTRYSESEGVLMNTTSNVEALNSELSAIQNELKSLKSESEKLRNEQEQSNKVLQESIKEKNLRDENMLSLLKEIVEKVY